MCMLALLLAAVAFAGATESGRPDGAAVFRARCARCHGESGRTDTAIAHPLKVRPLVGDPALARMTTADLVREIKSNAKHEGVGALTDLDDAELEAAAAFVKKLATTR